jgi:hypothetical protein
MPAITKPNQHFDATLYTGTGSNGLAVTNGGFQPDLIWLKSRNNTYYNNLLDSIRGAGVRLFSNLTDAESDNDCQSSFDSNGFTLNADSGGVNNSTTTYVAWQWKGGGTAVSNTSGTITSSVSANPTAGFSVVTYTHNGTNAATVGHGLGVTPSFIINKQRSAAATNWRCYHVSLTAGYNIQLNLTSVQGTAADIFQTAPTSSVFTPGNGDSASGKTMVAYCFAPIAGYSAFASFVGNGTQGAGPFVYTGFRPRYVLIKNINGAYDWHCFDTARGQFNYSGSNILKPNTSDAELTARNDVQIDFLSNGFRLIGNDVGINQSGSTHIYMAFAEAPFKFSNAR